MKFISTIFQSGNNLGIEIPEKIIYELGAGKKPPVVITIQSYTYRSTVAVMSGKFLVPLSSAHRKFTSAEGGDQIEIEIKLDDQPRNVEIPEDLSLRFEANQNAKKFFETLPPSSKKKVVTLLDAAKTTDTRIKRLDKFVSDLENKIKP